LFAPALFLMDRLRYAPKLFVIGLLLVGPLGYMGYNANIAVQEDVDFQRLELNGIKYLKPTLRMYGQMVRHRISAVTVAEGDRSQESAMALAGSETERLMKELEKQDKLFGREFKTSAALKDVKDKWSAVQSATAAPADPGKGRAIEAAHVALNGAVYELVANVVGNNSKLVLDPDTDSYWLMDAYVFDYQTMGNWIGQFASRAIRNFATPEEAGERFIEMAGLYFALNSQAGDVVATNLKNVQTSNKSVYEKLKTPIGGDVDTVSGNSNKLKAAYFQENALKYPGASEAAEQGVAAMAAVEDMLGYIEPQLNNIIKRRFDRYTAQQGEQNFTTILTIGLLVYLFFGFYLSVKLSVSSLGEFTRRMIAGTKERFSVRSKDELGQIANDYNQVNNVLSEARALKERTEGENSMLQENIMDMLGVVATASDGDLTVRARVSEGALGNVADAFNSLMDSLQSLMREVARGADLTARGVADIAKISKQMADGATTQAKELKAAQGLVENMASSLGSVASNASTAANAAKRTESSALEGARAVEEVITGMDGLRANVQAGAKKMKVLGDRSMEITGIVETINRISDQTNMLALNAAIEAARAGEHGRGFTVVAEEVRKLAERTATATQDIGKLVKAIHTETTETVTAIERQTQVVEQESATVANAGEQLNRIREASTESTGLVTSISNAATEQAEGTKKVVTVMDEVSRIAASTQTEADTTARTAGDLLTAAKKLTETIGKFRVA
jgi:methyl-accepting chemotaxis protein